MIYLIVVNVKIPKVPEPLPHVGPDLSESVTFELQVF